LRTTTVFGRVHTRLYRDTRREREVDVEDALRRRHHWVLTTHRYDSQEQLIADLGEKVIRPAELKVLDLQGST